MSEWQAQNRVNGRLKVERNKVHANEWCAQNRANRVLKIEQNEGRAMISIEPLKMTALGAKVVR
jgi:hypothetical protein